MQRPAALFTRLAQRHFALYCAVVIGGGGEAELVVILVGAQIALGAEHPNGDQHEEQKYPQAIFENQPEQLPGELKQPPCDRQ